MEQSSAKCGLTISGDVSQPNLSQNLENGDHNVLSNIVEQNLHSQEKTLDENSAKDKLVINSQTIHSILNNDVSKGRDFLPNSKNVDEEVDLCATAKEFKNTDAVSEDLEKLKTFPPIVQHDCNLVSSENIGGVFEEREKSVLTTPLAIISSDNPSAQEIDVLPSTTTLENAKETDSTFGILVPELENKDVPPPTMETECLSSMISRVLEDESVPLSAEANALHLTTASLLIEKYVTPTTKEKDVGITSLSRDNNVSLAENPENLPIVTSMLEEKDVPSAKETETIPVITSVFEDKKQSNSPVVEFPVVTPSFEEIPVIVKTEPEDIFIAIESTENETQPFGKHSESKAADISLITDLEIDFNYCASCKFDFRTDPNETPKKLKNFSSFNTVSGDVKTVSILEALLLIFDLRFVKCCTAFHREESMLQEISLCTQCAIMATQMYKLYTEFSELIHAESILSKLVNHENVLQNNAIAKAAAAKAHYETGIKDDNQDFSENLPNIRVRNPSEKQRKGVASIFESDNESEGDTQEVVNGLEGVRRNSLENKKRINVEMNRRMSVSNDKPITLNISPIMMSSRLTKSNNLRIKKEHGKVPVPVQSPKVVNVNLKLPQRPKRIFDVKQETFVQHPRKIARGNSMDNSVPSIVSVHSIANPSIVKDEARPCSSSSLQRTLRPKRTSCKIVDYSKQLGEESDEIEDDNDKDAEIFSEDEFDDDANDPDFSKKSKPKANIMLSKCAKKSKTKISPIEIKRMFDNERFLKDLSLPNLFPLTCKICKKTFRDLVSLERHKKTHKTVSSFPCFICGIICWNQNIFLTHLGTHIPEKPFVCDCCNAAFKIKGELDQHKLRHQELIIFTCQQCKECFPSLMLLNRHEAAIHMKETSYICPMCPAVQFERSDWSKHILTHAPFKCTKCDLFFNPNELKAHVQAFHPTQPPQKLQTPQKLQPSQSHSIFSDLLRAASQRIHH